MIVKDYTPVWVRGKVGYRTRKAVSIVALDRFSRERHHVCPRTLITGERDCHAELTLREFLVPAFWAYQNKLPCETLLPATWGGPDYQEGVRTLAGQPFIDAL